MKLNEIQLKEIEENGYVILPDCFSNEEVLMVGDDIVADIGGAKNIFLKTIQVKTGKFQIKDETNIYLQPDYRINSISELSYLLGIELTEKNY